MFYYLFLFSGNHGNGAFLSSEKKIITEVKNTNRGPMIAFPSGDLKIMEDTVGEGIIFVCFFILFAFYFYFTLFFITVYL